LKRAYVVYPYPPVGNLALDNEKTREEEKENDTKACKM